MTKRFWVKSFLSGLGLFGPKRRSSVWQKQARQTHELQTLESRLLMSSVSLSADPAGARRQTSDPAPFGTTTSIRGPLSIQRGAAASAQFTPAEDLYDEGAGAVWGGLMDPLGGNRSSLIPPASTTGGFNPNGPESDPGEDFGGGSGDGFVVCGSGIDGSVTGGGDIGGGSTGGSSVGGGTIGNLPQEELELLPFDVEALEGPYSLAKLDSAEVIIRRVGLSPQRSVSARFRISGTAVHQTDYRLSHDERPINPSREGHDLYATVTLLAGVEQAIIRLTTMMDADWEHRERVHLELVPAIDGSSRPSVKAKAEIIIDDATADLQITSMHSGGNFIQSPTEDLPGSMLRVNNDYDNGREIPDHVWYAQPGRAFMNGENDVMRLKLTSHLNRKHDFVFDDDPQWFQLQYDTTALRIYKRPTPSDTAGWVLISPETRLYLNDGRSWEFAVEGLTAAHGQISARWRGATMTYPAPAFDQVTATTWDVDLDVDSDNTNGLMAPDRSNWEEYIEDHTHGIGKLLFVPQGLPGPNQKPTLTTAAFSIAPHVYERGARFDFPGPQGDSGFIQLWSQPADIPGGLIKKPVENGGHLITSGYTYSDNQLKSFKGLWIEPVVAQRAHNTLEGVERRRPDDRIRMTATVRTAPDLPWMPLATDEVRYIVNETTDTFYPNLQFDRPRYWDRNDIMSGVVLRDALISEAVYDV
ncbi:MAG: Extracellular phospholipase precursor, partial [Planctomycetota bacterium]